MRVGGIFRKIGPFLALAAAAGLSACDDVDVSFNGEQGVPLAELDMSGEAPSRIALGGADNVVITTGEELAITVEGSEEATERLRFVLADGSLGIGREDGNWRDGDVATINVTMPAPSTIAIGGSGRMTADTMARNAEIVIGGSGAVDVAVIDSETLEITIGGSGRATVAGAVDRLELNIGGSGTADMADLQAGDAEVNIGGSGDATFSSDGTVEANIAGSGDVRVRGSARCEINAIGSGSLVCEDAPDDGDSTENARPAG
ncbi:head GIN domain-containing protein [Erythrobacter alti]|uniref:head GIN domain-containing protein n=1 Tax=Erythrobacter alti TaxID=1896145 RepID=UPI0030F483CE